MLVRTSLATKSDCRHITRPFAYSSRVTIATVVRLGQDNLTGPIPILIGFKLRTFLQIYPGI